MQKLQGNNTNHILYIFNESSLKIQFSIIFLVQNSIKIKKPSKKYKKKSLSCFFIILVEAPSK